MADSMTMGMESPFKMGFFDEDAFKDKSQQILVLDTGIAGAQHHLNENGQDGDAILEKLTPGMELKLYREPENEVDEWAIMVYTKDDEMLGYIPRYQNETIARLMDCGKKFTAFWGDPINTRGEENREKWRKRAPSANLKMPVKVYLEW